MRVLYLQLTLGGSHIARIQALDRVSGIQCRGVALAKSERTRAYQLGPEDSQRIDTLVSGVYEDVPLAHRLAATLRYFHKASPCTLILDSPSDPVQFAAGRLVQSLGGKTVTRWVSTRLDHRRTRVKELFKRAFYRGWDGYLVTGQRALEYLASFGVPLEKAALCGNPVNASLFQSGGGSPSPPRRPTFLYVGRFLAVKNLEMLISAYRAYRDLGGQWGLVLVGFGEMESALRGSTRDLPDVEFTGHLEGEALAARYRSEGCLVLPSYSEPWGLVVNEAMHAAMPVVVSSVCGCVPELVREGTNGFAVAPHDVTAWISTLQRISALDSAALGALGAHSRSLVAQHSTSVWALRVANAIRRAWQGTPSVTWHGSTKVL